MSSYEAGGLINSRLKIAAYGVALRAKILKV